MRRDLCLVFAREHAEVAVADDEVARKTVKVYSATQSCGFYLATLAGNDCSIDPFTNAYSIFWFAIPVQVSQQFTPQPTNLLQVPSRIRLLPQQPILMVHQTVNQPKLIMAQTRPDKLIGNPDALLNHPTAPRSLTIVTIKHVSAPA